MGTSGADLDASHASEMLLPRPRRSRMESNGKGIVAANALKGEPPASALSSGRTTPIPSDAPPSTQATSSVRKQIRAQNKSRLFPTIDYAPRVSHFDPRSEYTNFRGFFVLFWISLAIMAITAILRSLKETGYPLNVSQWSLFTENIGELALSDLLMAASTVLCLPLHRLYMSGSSILRWSKSGIVIQAIFEGMWLVFWVCWPFLRTWTWTAQVFFTLHILSLFMKMHSYAFYNGHLLETRHRLLGLDSPLAAASTSATESAAVRYPSAWSEKMPPDGRRPSKEINVNGIVHSAAVEQLREDLALELTSPLGRISYPANLTYLNFVDYLLCPTLCYELEYPRMPTRDYMNLFYKSLAVFGCIFLLTVTSEEFVIPVLAESSARLHMMPPPTLSEQALILAETISGLLFPFLINFLLVFLVIFEYLLGAFAEITGFADRHFYDDWWNSRDWLEFSRQWNIPVHHFFRRHVYAALSRPVPLSDAKPPTSRPVATAITFFVSAIAHELVMGCITKKLRGYGFVMMMMQIPIVMVQRHPLVRGRTLLNNVLFWCSMILGLSMMCALYVLV
ncbi:hypothetical protein P152DRAFT_428738 [Eremomyces bilateralis CBS 781.70]|uniref:O-acyltransferase n=1 Tax=Eremomyces bilateralis CBS 781.70 TaxID=1392243 RepID=A0A6G1GEU7_9PEZI|nr:uncharacterized protein P152DRAFT_428738 [Eremomyces bilateralis CBS 781.70]KAF1816554.1 hypothetical protein P152DRAFT_428738 [Eremomyces bilateralis CBS 781.70]